MIRCKLVIGATSKLSNQDDIASEGDQLIPSASSNRITRKRKFPMDRNSVDDHLDSLNEMQSQTRIIRDYNYTSIRDNGKFKARKSPEKFIDKTKDLYKMVNKVYERGNRSMRLLRLVQETRTMIPLSVAVNASEYILRIWEIDSYDNQTNNSYDNQISNSLTNFIANLVYRASPSIITIFAATFYIGRLRRLHPKAKGGSGCVHRLFAMSLLIAYRYFETQHSFDGTFYDRWSSFTNGLFQASDLIRMEMEMISFLKFNLYISYEDFEYFVDRVYNNEGGQVVPRCFDFKDLAPNVKYNDMKDDASVPNQLF